MSNLEKEIKELKQQLKDREKYWNKRDKDWWTISHNQRKRIEKLEKKLKK